MYWSVLLDWISLSFKTRLLILFLLVGHGVSNCWAWLLIHEMDSADICSFGFGLKWDDGLYCIQAWTGLMVIVFINTFGWNYMGIKILLSSVIWDIIWQMEWYFWLYKSSRGDTYFDKIGKPLSKFILTVKRLVLSI